MYGRKDNFSVEEIKELRKKNDNFEVVVEVKVWERQKWQISTFIVTIGENEEIVEVKKK